MNNQLVNLDHCSITVRNLDESVKFYEKYLGLKKIGNFELTIDAEGDLKGVKMKIAFMKAGDGNFELIEYVDKDLSVKLGEIYPWHIGAQHIAFQIDKVEEFYNKYKNEIQFISLPIHSVAKDLDVTWTYFKDPNGALIEVSEDHLK